MESILAVNHAAEQLTKACTEAILHRAFDDVAKERLPQEFIEILTKRPRKRRK
jgi:hypothetical protein